MIKVAFLTSIYPTHVQLIYKQHPDLANKSSTEQEEFVNWHALSSFVRWFKLLKANGYETCAFNKSLQEINLSWAKENHYSPNTNKPILEIGKERIRRFDPDIIFCFAPITYIKNGWMKALAEACSKPLKTIAWYGANQGEEDIFRNFDLTLSNSKHLVNQLRIKGIQSEFLQHSFDPIIVDEIEVSQKKKNRVAFFGNLDMSTSDFSERTNMLEKVSLSSGKLDIFGEIDIPSIRERLHHATLRLRNDLSLKTRYLSNNSKIAYWSEAKNLPPNPWKVSKEFAKTIKAPIFGKEMLERLSSYKIALNYHNKHTGNHACNMRLFEATGLGSTLLTDAKSDLKDYFEPNKEVISYSSASEAEEKIKFLIDNPRTATQIGQAGQRKCFNSHSTEKQINRLSDIFKTMMI
jgi:spore maturation protein CgeB